MMDAGLMHTQQAFPTDYGFPFETAAETSMTSCIHLQVTNMVYMCATSMNSSLTRYTSGIHVDIYQGTTLFIMKDVTTCECTFL